jgi:shikimate dehydrogenase
MMGRHRDGVALSCRVMTAIDARTRVCGIIGHPVGHSLSPAIHNASFTARGLPYVYVAHDVPPGRAAAAVEAARVLGYRGLSVTIPHKVDAMKAVDEVDETARGIGCINTVVNQDGRLFGTNSDGLGALEALRQAGADPRGNSVLVLGTGGAARALAMTLSLRAAPRRLVLLGIEEDEGRRLAADARSGGTCEVALHRLESAILREEIKRADLLLHCTPVGMHPEDNATLVPQGLLHAGLTVFDAVYNPRRTRLLREAAAVGARVVEGLEMFLGQAAVQFELWTGEKAPLDVMRRVVEESL